MYRIAIIMNIVSILVMLITVFDKKRKDSGKCFIIRILKLVYNNEVNINSPLHKMIRLLKYLKYYNMDTQLFSALIIKRFYTLILKRMDNW